jgi:hypothetical protein
VNAPASPQERRLPAVEGLGYLHLPLRPRNRSQRSPSVLPGPASTGGYAHCMSNDPSRPGHHLRGKITRDVFDRTPEEQASSAAMNSMFASMRDSAAGTLGTSGRTGEPTPTDPAIRDRLSTALTESEQAKRSGDPERIAYAEHILDTAIGAARESREGSQQARDEHGQFTSEGFDGGIRGRRTGAKPVPHEPRPQRPNEALQNLIDVSKAAHKEQTRERPLSDLTGHRSY